MPDSERQNLAGMLHDMNVKFDAYVEKDMAWKKTADEKLEIVSSVQGFGKVSLYILGFLAALGVGVGIIYQLIKWLKQ